MTPEEAIEIAIHCLGVQAEQEVCEECDIYGNCHTDCKDVAVVAIKSLKEIQQYREIGTVEECRKAMSRYREREKTAKCEECLFLEERKTGRNGAIIGICRIKPQNGRRYGKSCACRFFEKDYENLEGMEDE